MLGRGTRKGERFPDKSHFTVFDCFDGTLVEYFRMATDITAEPLEQESRTIVQVIDDIWQNKDRTYNVACLTKRLQRIDKEMSGEARDMFAAFVPAGDLGRYARELPARLKEDFQANMRLPRRKDFQELLKNFPRPMRSFLIAHEATDVVSSSWLVRGLDGKEYKPADYLTAFAGFVRDNRNTLRLSGFCRSNRKGGTQRSF